MTYPLGAPKLRPMSVTEIEAAIVELPIEDLTELITWLEGHHEQIWDKQIAEDLEAGRLDAVLAEVDKEYAAGLASPL